MGQFEGKLSRAFCAVAGLALLVTAMVQTGHRDWLAGFFVAFGTLLVLSGCLADRIKQVFIDARRGSASLTMQDPDPVAAITSAFVGENPDEPAQRVRTDEAVDANRVALAQVAFEALLEPSGPLSDADFEVFLYDGDVDRLLPILEEDGGDSEGWEEGKGVVGFVWAYGEAYAAEAPATCDGTFGLTPAQQEKYRDLTAVVGVPVQNAVGDRIGVLAASSVASDTVLTSDEAVDDMVSRAEGIARVLVDVLRWFPDGSEV